MTNTHPVYDPPPGPPPTQWHPPDLLPAQFPLLAPFQTHILSTQGFTPLAISQRFKLLDAASILFAASRAFFALPPADKTQFQVRTSNAQGSEEGWSRVPGEKELLTVRRGGHDVCPPSLEAAAQTLWHECGSLLQEIMRGVEQSLGMSHGALDGVVGPECTMPKDGADRLETLLRMFRYERHSPEANARPADDERSGKGRLVAEPHRDLGLLSLVIGASPGLEVWDTSARAWIPIEEPPHAGPGITATLLVGETLTRLTNERYAPGRHRVFVPSSTSEQSTDPSDESQYRYSLVFALRPHASALISTALFTTPLTGVFAHPLEGVRARELFKAIASSHWNVNTTVKEREKQKMRLQGGKDGESELSQGQNADAKENVWGTRHGEEAQNAKKKKRWSVPTLTSSRVPPDDAGDDPRPKRWSFFQRISRR